MPAQISTLTTTFVQPAILKAKLSRSHHGLSPESLPYLLPTPILQGASIPGKLKSSPYTPGGKSMAHELPQNSACVSLIRCPRVTPPTCFYIKVRKGSYKQSLLHQGLSCCPKASSWRLVAHRGHSSWTLRCS